MFTHMHHERMVSVLENAPEYAGPVPADEWHHERDANRISEMLHESAKQVRDAVTGRMRRIGFWTAISRTRFSCYSF